jgi:hypothetical protein
MASIDCKHVPKKGSITVLGNGQDDYGCYQVRRAYCRKCGAWYAFRMDKDADGNDVRIRHTVRIQRPRE